MDIIALNEAATANSRIESFIENPDSTSGVVTVPTRIAAGETITIPAGRMAVLPDLQIDGDLIVDGEVFIPNGTSLSKVVEKVPSTDNAIVRFDGITGAVQNSGVVIDDSGNVGIGLNNPQTRLHISSDNSSLPAGSAQFIISGDSNKERMAIRSSTTGASVINVGSCGGTIALPTATQSGAFLGSYQFGGYATTRWERGAQVAGYSSGNWTDSSMPSEIVFQTVSSSSTTLTERMRIYSNGNVLVTGSGGLGYGNGSGGIVTQLTSKSTAVTLNKPTGQITMNNAALAAGATIYFLLNNTLITADDVIITTIKDGTGADVRLYRVEAISQGSSFSWIKVTNTHSSSLSESIVIKYAIIKGANS